jgi:hypothetical protein
MSELLPDLPSAFSAILDKIDRLLTEANYNGPAIRMYLAGGLAVHHYCGSRYTNDIDASFSQRLLLPAKELVAAYRNGENKPEPLYFDANYNPDFALMHPDHRENAVEWKGLGNEKRRIILLVLSPVDLAVSKLARHSEQDQADIVALAEAGLLTASDLRARASEALEYFVGNKTTLQRNIEKSCQAVASSRKPE